MDKLILDRITVKQLIILLLEEPMENNIIFRKGQKRLRNVKIYSREQPKQNLAALFS